MERYNQVMLYFWLLVGVFALAAVTYFGLTEEGGFQKWGYYYIFAVLAFLMFFMRRYMMRRMKKHMAYLEEKEKKERSENN